MILQVHDLRIGFGPLRAVDGLSFSVREGEVFAIIGESGSGKSLTGMSVLGLLPPQAHASGSVRLGDDEILGRSEKDLRQLRGRAVGVVYQDPLSALNPVWPVGAQIAEALRTHGLADRRTAARRAMALLEQVHIPAPARVARAYPHEISGGMRQRARIAMAIACGPRLLIADEPTTALDVTIKAQILDLLLELRRGFGLAIVLITHDMGVVAEVADRILVMYAGRAVEIGPAAQILDRPAHPYTRALLTSAMIAEAPPKSEVRAISGTAPRLDGRPDGCAFHPRCPHAADVCRVQEPALRQRDGADVACHFPDVAAA